MKALALSQEVKRAQRAKEAIHSPCFMEIVYIARSASEASRGMAEELAYEKGGSNRNLPSDSISEDRTYSSEPRRLAPPYFFWSSSPTILGTGSYFANSIVNSALPWLMERNSVA